MDTENTARESSFNFEYDFLIFLKIGRGAFVFVCIAAHGKCATTHFWKVEKKTF